MYLYFVYKYFYYLYNIIVNKHNIIVDKREKCMWTYIWLAVLAVSLIVEFVTMELVSVWVAVGAVGAMILALCEVQLEIQLAVFVVVSIACILGLRRITLKLLNRNKDKTNIDVVIGTTHKLIKPITEDELGSIKINGVEWNVKFQNFDVAGVGEPVEILEVDGNKFIVKKVNSTTVKEETKKEEVILDETSKEKPSVKTVNKSQEKSKTSNSKTTVKKSTKK